MSASGGRLDEQAVLDPVHAAPFPAAALPMLRNPQLRKNVAHATDVIQAKRARLVAEKSATCHFQPKCGDCKTNG